MSTSWLVINRSAEDIQILKHNSTTQLSSCEELWTAARFVSGHSFHTWSRSGPGGLFCPPPKPAVLQGKCHNAAQIRKFLKESPIIRRMQSKAITSPFLAAAVSQALVESVSLCILKQCFPPLSPGVYKSKMPKDLFLQSEAQLFCSSGLCVLSCAL